MDLKEILWEDREKGIFRIRRTAITSQEIFELEREKIFNKCWLYAFHSSEVEKPGDYITRKVAEKPLLIVRGSDSEVRVFYNTCTHRGAAICREKSGNASTFNCFYHGWCFRNDGSLVSVPDPDGYASTHDRHKLNLKRVPHVDNYRGLYFVNFSENPPNLDSYLSKVKEPLDLVFDQVEGDFKIIPGSNEYYIRANWKLLPDNSLDVYHYNILHRSFVDYQVKLGIDRQKFSRLHNSLASDLGNGHAVKEDESGFGRPIAHWSPLFGEEAKDEIAQIQQDLVKKYGRERAWKMTELVRNTMIFPNLIILDNVAINVRQCWPVAPNKMRVLMWHLVPKDEEGKALKRRLDSFLTFFGVGGFGSPDDAEALESSQIGCETLPDEWLDMSRGMHRTPFGRDELPARIFWRQWYYLMTQE